MVGLIETYRFYKLAKNNSIILRLLEHLAKFIEKSSNAETPRMTKIILEVDKKPNELLHLWATNKVHSPIDRIEELRDELNSLKSKYNMLLMELGRKSEV